MTEKQKPPEGKSQTEGNFILIRTQAPVIPAEKDVTNVTLYTFHWKVPLLTVSLCSREVWLCIANPVIHQIQRHLDALELAASAEARCLLKVTQFKNPCKVFSLKFAFPTERKKQISERWEYSTYSHAS